MTWKERARYSLPDGSHNVSEMIGLCVSVPNDRYHIAAFMGQISALGYWFAWQLGSGNAGKGAADLWRASFESLAADYNAGLFCNMAVYRIDPTDGCIIQQSTDNGTTWDNWFDSRSCNVRLSPATSAQNTIAPEIGVTGLTINGNYAPAIEASNPSGPVIFIKARAAGLGPVILVDNQSHVNQPLLGVFQDGGYYSAINSDGQIVAIAYHALPAADGEHENAIVTLRSTSGLPDTVWICVYNGVSGYYWTAFEGQTGPQGPVGPASTVPGPQGPVGPASTVPGPQGPAGPASTVPGPQGPAGHDGSFTLPMAPPAPGELPQIFTALVGVNDGFWLQYELPKDYMIVVNSAVGRWSYQFPAQSYRITNWLGDSSSPDFAGFKIMALLVDVHDLPNSATVETIMPTTRYLARAPKNIFFRPNSNQLDFLANGYVIATIEVDPPPATTWDIEWNFDNAAANLTGITAGGTPTDTGYYFDGDQLGISITCSNGDSTTTLLLIQWDITISQPYGPTDRYNFAVFNTRGWQSGKDLPLPISVIGDNTLRAVGTPTDPLAQIGYNYFSNSQQELSSQIGVQFTYFPDHAHGRVTVHKVRMAGIGTAPTTS